MAGRPVARGGGGSGLVYGLIAFAVVSVLCLGGMIFALTGVKSAQEEASRHQARLNQYGTPPSYYADEATARGSKVFAVMAEDIETIAERLTGNRAAARPTLERQIETVRADIVSRHGEAEARGPLIQILQNLDRKLTQVEAENADLRRTRTQLEQERDSLTAGLKTTQDQFESTVGGLRDEVARLQRDKQATLGAKDDQLREFQSTADARNEELNRERSLAATHRRETEIHIGRQDQLITTLQDELGSLKSDTFDPEAILRKADGRVLRAIPGSDIVYIDVGTADGVKPGLGFEVYAETFEQRSPEAGVRGKATIEVVTAYANTSECIVRRTTPALPIVEGDLIVNIAFERGRKPRFVVRGSFDLNYDGMIDVNDQERVASLIREWGGQVVPGLDASVDFVVVGVAPYVPEVPRGRRVTPVIQVQLEHIQVARQGYADLIEQARTLNIPVITQSQLLFLTGYTGDINIRQR